MKIVLLLAVGASTAAAFTTQMMRPVRLMTELKDGYVPDGMTPEEYERQKYRDKHPKHHQHFLSRSFQTFQKDLEAGKIRHLFPTMFAKQRVKKHNIRSSDVPYMQREGGRFDNEDVNVGYVPDGMTPHEWHEMQHKEKKAKAGKDFTSRGPTKFKSRSLQSFQEDLQKGKAQHLMPQMFAKERVERGLLKKEDVPYMQRYGSWDNSDVKGAEKKSWSETDKKYARGEGPFAALMMEKKTTRQEEKKETRNKFFGLWP